MEENAILENVKVIWFDDVNGIGSGKTSSGQEVFLKWESIEKDGRFLTLKENETVSCEISLIDGNAVAIKILRQPEKEKASIKTTLAEPKPLDIQL